MKIVDDTKMKIGWFVNRIHPHPLSATFLVKGTFDLHHGGPATLSPKQENLNGDVPGENGDLDYASDFAWFKPKTDVLLSGTCHSRGGKPTPVSRVTFQVGNWSKQLVVVGNRVRQKKMLIFTTASDPEPFEKMKLSYGLSYGGEKYPLNPVGRGHRGGSGPLPNLVEPDQVMIAAESRPRPAGFGPISPAWAQRTHRPGTYGKRWEKERWPGFPADYDWTMQNAAPRDQQLPARLRGDEKLVFENLHPEHPVYETRLPGIRARWFIRETDSRFREVELDLDTLWVDMDAEKLILLWRGVVDIRNKRMPEILERFILAEPVDAPRKSLPEYSELLEKRIAEEAEALKFKPIRIRDASPSTPTLPDMSWRKAFDEKVDAARREMAKLLEEGDRKIDKAKKRVASIEGMPGWPVSPESTDPKSSYEKAIAVFQELKKKHPDSANLDPDFPSWEKMEKALSPKAPKAPVVPEPRVRPEPWTRERVEAHAKAGGRFDGEDLRDLDLSEISFEGGSFKRALLTGANLTRTVFTGADLTKAVLSGADLADAVLTGANLAGALLEKAKLSAARLTDARLEGASFSRAEMKGAILSRASGKLASFFEANLEESDFSGANLPSADFQGANLARATCVGARFENAMAGRASAPGINLEGASLAGFRATPGADFSNANLKKIVAPGSIWEEAILDGADLRESNLCATNFFRTSLERANLSLCDMKKARLNEARLTRADLLKTNLFQGDFAGAVLVETDFRGSNLFRAEFLDAKIEGCSFQNANLTGTKLA